jgi:hypothetical protein
MEWNDIFDRAWKSICYAKLAGPGWRSTIFGSFSAPCLDKISSAWSTCGWETTSGCGSMARIWAVAVSVSDNQSAYHVKRSFVTAALCTKVFDATASRSMAQISSLAKHRRDCSPGCLLFQNSIIGVYASFFGTTTLDVCVVP